MGVHDALRDGEPEADAAGFRIARRLEPHERLERIDDAIGRNAGPGVGHLDDGFVTRPIEVETGRATVADGILDEVAHGPLERHRPAWRHRTLDP